MTFKEITSKVGIVYDCEYNNQARWGTYEIQFINSKTNEDDYVTFDVRGAGTNSGIDQAENLFKDFCKTEGIKQNNVTAVHIVRECEDMSLFGKL